MRVHMPSGTPTRSTRWLHTGGAPARFAGVALLAACQTFFGGCGDPIVSDAGGLRVIRTFGEVGTAPGQLSYPRAMDSTSDGRLVVIDKTARIQVIDPTDGSLLGGFRPPDWSQGRPTGLTVGPHPFEADRQAGREALWVADTHYHRVLVYDLESAISADIETRPEPLLSFGSYGREPGQLIYPTDVAVAIDADGGVLAYVSEYGGNDRVTRFKIAADGSATPEFAFGGFGHAHEDGLVFHRPQSLLWDEARRELVVADSGNHRVGRFTPEGELLAWMGSPETAGEGPGSFFYPRGVELLSDGTLLVAEFGGNRLQRVDLHAGESLGVFGEPGRGLGQLATPWGVVLIGGDADAGEVAVLDSGNNRLHITRVESFLVVRDVATAVAMDEPALGGGG